MRIAIIGAGIAGLAAARKLKEAGKEVVIYEKSRGPGGRVHTRSHDLGYRWDTGATSIAPRGKAIEAVMLKELAIDTLVEIKQPIWTHSNLRTSPGRKGTHRYTYTNGNQAFANLLAAPLEVIYEAQVDEIKKVGAGYRVLNQDFDAVVLTPPIPQTSQLLWTMDESRPLANARYRPCLSVLLGFDAPNPNVSYHALLDLEQVHPMTWLSLESVKSTHRAAEGKSAMVIQLSARFSLDNYAKSDEFIMNAATNFTKQLFGSAYAKPEVGILKKWKYSQPEGLARFEEVNIPGSTLIIASDGLLGGHVEDAFECGYKAAEVLINA